MLEGFLSAIGRNGFVIFERGTQYPATRDAEMCEERAPYLRDVITIWR